MAAPMIDGYSGLEEIGEGGFATVYRARQDRLDRQVALKVLRAKNLDEATVRRFERECHAMGDLSWHPHVVGVFDSGVTTDGHPWLTMEFMARGSIADRVRQRGPLPWAEALEIGVQVAGALGAVHAAGRIHRDVKPENLLVGPFGEVKLGDFGIAVGADASSATAAQFTPGFVATEVLRGESPDERSDIYSLAATLHALIAGHSPFATQAGEPISALLLRAIDGERPRLEGVPDDMADLVVQCLDTDPMRRLQSAAAMGAALQGLQRTHELPVTILRITAETDGAPAGDSAPDASSTIIGGQFDTGDASATIIGGAAPVGQDPLATIVGQVPSAPNPGITPSPPSPHPPPPPPPHPPLPPPVQPVAAHPPTGPVTPKKSNGKVMALAAGGAVTVVVLLIGAIVALGGGDDESGSGSGGSTTSSAVSTPVETEAEIVATIAVGAGPRDLALSFNGRDVWVANTVDSTVSRIAVASDEVVATIDTDDSPTDIATSEEQTWVSSIDGRTLTAIDTTSNEVVANVAVDGKPSDVLSIGDFIYAATSRPNALVEIDVTDLDAPSTRQMATVGGPVSGLAFGATTFWVGDFDGTAVARVPFFDPALPDVEIGANSFDVVADGTRVYVSNNENGTVTIIDDATGEVEGTVEVGETALGMTVTTGGVWVVSGPSTVTRIEGLAVAETVEAGVALLDVVAIGNDLWVSDEVSDEVLRLRISDG